MYHLSLLNLSVFDNPNPIIFCIQLCFDVTQHFQILNKSKPKNIFATEERLPRFPGTTPSTSALREGYQGDRRREGRRGGTNYRFFNNH